MNKKPKAKAKRTKRGQPPKAKSDPIYILRLYITGQTPRSATSVRNIREVCEQRLAGRFELEVIDIYQQPELAQQAQIVAAPTLVKRLPLPLRRLVGNLSDRQKLLIGLNLESDNLASEVV
jgi:circadian clock protein KaiB